MNQSTDVTENMPGFHPTNFTSCVINKICIQCSCKHLDVLYTFIWFSELGLLALNQSNNLVKCF